jgi:hypothetical protein
MTRDVPIHRVWRLSLSLIGAALAIPGSAQAQAVPQLAAQPAPKPPAQPATEASPRPKEPPKVKELIVSPAAVPVPAFRYRLLPNSAGLNPGDAAPIYLRIRFQANKKQEEAWSRTNHQALVDWLNLPLDRFPTAEVRRFVDLWADQLKQIEFGARRRACDWNYTLAEQRVDSLYLNLSDVQSMREWGTMLALKTRVEIAEGKLDDAVGDLETGLAFARHVAQGPFMINYLAGVGIARVMLDRCEELIARPGAPNLYWALTALPRPLASARSALEFDGKLCENMIPELTEAELARPRTAAEWASLLSRMHEGIVKWTRKVSPDESTESHHALKIMGGADLAAFKAKALPGARDFLKTSRRLADAQLAAMSEDQVVALYLAGGYRALWDDLFKGSYLSPREGLPELRAAEERVHAAKYGPLTFFVQMTPAVWSVVATEARLDRRVALLRVIEALRMDATHEGDLPKSLDQITEVPVPDDPVTGTPFDYRREGSAALLAGAPSRQVPRDWDPSYRITIRRGH